MTNFPIISVSKNGRDDLLVTNFAMDMMTNDVIPEKTRYTCGGFTLRGDCKAASLCRHVFNGCAASKQKTPKL